MALSKISFLLVCVFFALFLLVSSEATSDAHTTDDQANELEDAKYGGPGYGGRGPGYGGGGPGYGGGYHGGHGRGCPYGCCRRFRYRNGCDRCCRDANEVPDASFADDDVKN